MKNNLYPLVRYGARLALVGTFVTWYFIPDDLLCGGSLKAILLCAHRLLFIDPRWSISIVVFSVFYAWYLSWIAKLFDQGQVTRSAVRASYAAGISDAVAV